MSNVKPKSEIIPRLTQKYYLHALKKIEGEYKNACNNVECKLVNIIKLK